MSDFQDRWLPTYIKRDLTVLFCGINPGRVSATKGFHYANPANLFWRGLHEGGLTPRRLKPEETAQLLDYGYGITDLVSRPTRSAGDLTPADFAAGREGFVRMVQTYRPRLICFNGITAFRQATGQRHEPVSPGLVPGLFFGNAEWPGCLVFVIPSTSGANAGYSREEKIRKFRELSDLLIAKGWHPLHPRVTAQ
jgi:TDG/mug DNA glycosylase family protein